VAKDLLLEIGTEELPSGAVDLAIEQLKQNAQNALENSRLSFESLQAFGTPRRLVLMVKKLAQRQKELINEAKGPPKKVAYDSEGKATKAALGFAKTQGVAVDDLVTKDAGQGEYVFALKKEPGQLTPKLLPVILPELISSFSFPKSMRWNMDEIRFARPMRWLLALYGKELVKFSLGELKSGNLTWGHRLLTKKPFEVKNPRSYFDVMDLAQVIPDQGQREELILREIEKAAHEISKTYQDQTKPIINPRVLSEVIHLVEFPRVIWGSFSQEYLLVPPEVLISAMESHQRYFPVQGSKGLLPAFIVVHNGDPRHEDIIRRGHERVLGTRLADAKFFFEADQKTSLEEKALALKGVVFQEKLGTLFEKQGRVKTLAKHIGKNLGLDDSSLKNLERAAYLSKADLVTELVNEFPALQGAMGRVYAKLSGEPEEVSQAIFEHYLPRSTADNLPQTTLGQVLSIADKVDTIVGCFLVNLIPTGSEDPYSLRRQAQGIISIILEKELPLSLEELIDVSLKNYEEIPFTPEKKTELLDFFRNRLRAHFLSQRTRYDILDAVLEGPLENSTDLKKRIDALSSYPKEKLEDVWITFTRCNNLAQEAAGREVKTEFLQDKEEKELFSKLLRAEENLSRVIEGKDYPAALDILRGLRPSVDAFFDEVLVMAKDEKIKRNRLAILNKSLSLFLKIADFSKLVFEGEPNHDL